MNKQLFIAVSSVTTASIIGYGISFVKAALVAALLGVSWQMDIFLLDFSIIYFFASLTSAPIISVVIPEYLRQKAISHNKSVDYIGASAGLLLLIFSFLTVIVFIFSPEIAQFFGKNNQTLEQIKKSEELIKLMVPVILFTGLSSLFQAVLNAEKIFFYSTISNAFQPLIVIICLLLGSKEISINFQAIGISLGTLAQFVFLLVIVKKHSLISTWSINYKVEGIKKTIQLLSPLVGTQALILSIPIIDRNLASIYPEGIISSLGYAQTLSNMSATIFLTALQTAILPFISQNVVDEGIEGLSKTFSQMLRFLVVLLIPVSTFFIFFREPFVKIIFERGAFDINATLLTSKAFAAYMVGIVPMGITFFCSRAFNAIQDSKTNALIGSFIYFLIKIIANLVLINFFGFVGIAYANAFAYLVAGLMMIIILDRKIKNIGIPILLFDGFKSLISGFLASGISWYIVIILFEGKSLLKLIFGALIFLIFYLLISNGLKIESVITIQSRVFKQLGKIFI